LSGRNYVTSLPTEFGKEIEKNYNCNIDKLEIDQKIIITAPFDPFRKRVLRNVKVDVDNETELTMKIVSAYLDGFDLIELLTTSAIPDKAKNALIDILPGINVREKPSAKGYEIMFFDVYEISLKDMFGRIADIFRLLSEKTQEAFGAFPDVNSMENIRKTYIKEFERQLDHITYQVRRYLNKCMIYPELYEKLELGNDRDIIHLTSIFVYFERLGDLHEEISEHLCHISQSLKKADISNFKIRPFSEYYSGAVQTILRSIDAQSDAWIGLDIIDHKLRKWSGHVLGKCGDEIKKIIVSQKDPELIRELVVLEGKLRAIPDVSSNVCELAWNKDRNAMTRSLQ